MSMNVSDFVWQRLQEWGIKRVYGYPGDGVGGLDVALEKAKDNLQYIQVRHEEMAAFMASAHAKFTGRGRALLRHLRAGRDPSTERPVRREDGPRARRRHCRSAGAHRHRARIISRKSICNRLFKDVAARFCRDGQRARSGPPSDRSGRPHRIHQAIPSPASSSPTIFRSWTYEDPPVVHGTTHTGVGYAGPAQLPNDDLLRQAAAVLNAGKKVAILVGAGALGATDEVIAVAEKLQAGVAKALLGKAALPDDLGTALVTLLAATCPNQSLSAQCGTLIRFLVLENFKLLRGSIGARFSGLS